jgi:hypothetical protein
LLNPIDTLRRWSKHARLREFIAVALVCAVSTVIVTLIIGDLTVYADENADKRQQMHMAILENTPPGGKAWEEWGANNLNVRIAVVLLVENIASATGQERDFVYRILDLVCLFAALVFTYYSLQRWFAPLPALAGVLIVCTLLPLTMLDHYFHPWDRPILVLWAAMIWCLARERLFVFACVYLLAVVVKLDSLMGVGMIWFAYVRRDDWLRPTLVTAGIGFLGLLALGALLLLLPGGQEPIDIGRQLARNGEVAASLGIAYPPLLVYGLLAMLGLFGWSSGEPVPRRLFVFGLVMLIPHLLFTNFVEVRAQVGSVLCLLPLATQGLLASTQAVRASPAR